MVTVKLLNLEQNCRHEQIRQHIQFSMKLKNLKVWLCMTTFLKPIFCAFKLTSSRLISQFNRHRKMLTFCVLSLEKQKEKNMLQKNF